MLKFYRKMQETKSVNTIVCILDLVNIKYFGNNTIEIKNIVFTCPDLLTIRGLNVELELIHVITAVPAPDDGCQHLKHVELPTEM